MRTQQMLLAAAAAVGLLIVILLAVALAGGGRDDAPRARRAGAGASDFSAALEAALPATVMIAAPGRPGAADTETMPMGSGFVASPEGLIVTAAHVVGDLPVVTVVLFDGSARPAERVGVDPVADVAVFRFATIKPLQALEVADSTLVKPGEPVALLGAPYGLPGTATSGIVSAVGRRLSAEDPGAYIQTDAALTAGGSGGPLIDLDGKVLGIASAKLSRGEAGAGLAFVIPATVVRQVLDRFSAAGPQGVPAAKPERP